MCMLMLRHAVFPTRVGVFLARPTRCAMKPSLPHASGGVSEAVGHANAPKASSPREWGCFQLLHVRLPLAQVFPTRVGVFLRRCHRRHRRTGLPHASGGVSRHGYTGTVKAESSPREWGCFQENKPRIKKKLVFPTRVGVFLPASARSHCCWGLPHASGGVSEPDHLSRLAKLSSPREWGCF